MKLYTLDLGWAGGFVVLAENKEKAAELILSEDKHAEVDQIEEHELTPNLIIAFMGDR